MTRETYLILTILAVSYLPAEAQTCTAYVGGYIPSWRDPGTVDYAKLTHVFYAFATTNANGDIIVDNPAVFNSFKTASAGKQRYLSLGGGADNTLRAMANSASARLAFASNCVTLCQTHDLQGVDMDWEGIITAQDSTHYGALMRALASSLHSNGLNLTATISYGRYGGDFYNLGALKTADWIQLMVYDQTGTWADSPYGNHSTYQHMLDAINYWVTRGYSNLSSIVIGLPFYGYRFNSTRGGLATGMAYSEIVSAHPGLSCDWDEVDLIVFNSPETIRKKVRYVMEKALKGVMIWEMGQDLNSSNDKSLLKAVSLAACNLPAACDTFITAGINNTSPEESVRFFPNPVHATLNIAVDQPGLELCKIELINNLGQRLSMKETSFAGGNEAVNVSDISPGIYYVRITQGVQKTIVRKVIKMD